MESRSNVVEVYSQQILRGPGGTTLSVVGTFRATLTYKERQICETVFVLED